MASRTELILKKSVRLGFAGNSLRMTVPEAFAEGLDWDDGDIVSIRLDTENRELVITKESDVLDAPPREKHRV